jgi:3-oxoacyl-[acyl-carrier protein] reductase
MDLGLVGRHVLVAGASKGLGFAVTSMLLKEGARVAAVARDEATLQEANSKWMSESPGSVVQTLALDLSVSTSVDPLRKFIAAIGTLDGVIVVAGSGRPSDESMTEAFGKDHRLGLVPIQRMTPNIAIF